MENYNENASTKGTVAFILGLIGLICLFWQPLFSIILGPIAIVLGVKGKKESPKGKRALSIWGMVFGIIDTLAIVAVVLVSIIFYTIMWPSITNDVELSTYCNTAYCDKNGKNCTYIDNSGKTVTGADCSKFLTP